jgi:vacuolar-type H+-ATPase subunit I/STV1
MGKAAGSLAAGAMIALVGFIFLMLGATYLLNKSLEMWIAAGIVGLALLLIGAILVMSGKNKLSAASLKPTRTIDSIKEDQEWASHQIKSVGK